MKSIDRVMAQVEIRWPEASWVLGAHLYAVLVPLVLVLAVDHHWDYLLENTFRPALFYVVVGLFCAGSAFEVAQNAMDRWMLAFWFMTVGQAVMAVAIGGDQWWVNVIAVIAVLAFPVFYLAEKFVFLPMAVVGTLTAVLAYLAFGDPVIFLQLLLAQVTMFFFHALLETGAQALHGFTTASAASGVWFLVWAIHNGAAGTPMGWVFVIGVVVAAAMLRFALQPLLSRLPMSPRIVRQKPSTS